jgi:ABC-type multidrug transport system fused ATPase/permease subunit
MAMYRLPYAEVLGQDAGYFVSRIYDEPLHVSEVVNCIVELASSLLLFAGAFCVCLWLSWKMAVVISLIVPLLRWTASRYRSRISGVAVEEREQEARLREALGRAAGAYKTVRMFDLQEIVKNKIHGHTQSFFGTVENRVRYSSAFEACSGVLLSYAEMAVLIGAGFEVLNGTFTIGSLFGFVSAYSRVVEGYRTLSSLVPTLAVLDGEVTRVKEFVRASTVPAGSYIDGIMTISDGRYCIRSRPVIDGCNLVIHRGEKVLVTGPNGSGKTTLMHILTGFLPLEQGTVSLPDPARVSALLTPFSFVPGTLRDNARYSLLSHGKRERFTDLAVKFGLIRKLDQDPVSLSEGEKKKFEVIMTLLKDAEFYIFDEPLANVDEGTSDAVMESIFALTKGKAVIVVMHGVGRHQDKFDRQFILDHDAQIIRAAVQAIPSAS